MSEVNTTSQPAYEGRRMRKGTRMLRWRTLSRVPQQGQPERPIIDPGLPRSKPVHLTCAECFGPRSRYQDGPFCYQCERALFGDGRQGYTRFIRSERQRRVMARRKGQPVVRRAREWCVTKHTLDNAELGQRVRQALHGENVGGPAYKAGVIANRGVQAEQAAGKQRKKQAKEQARREKLEPAWVVEGRKQAQARALERIAEAQNAYLSSLQERRSGGVRGERNAMVVRLPRPQEAAHPHAELGSGRSLWPHRNCTGRYRDR
jgi:hypothetical protein